MVVKNAIVSILEMCGFLQASLHQKCFKLSFLLINMGIAIGIIAIKGGVGKTTIAASLSSDLANHYKKKVLLIDANYSSPNLGLHMDILSPEKTIHHVLDQKMRIESAIHNKYGVDIIPGNYAYNKSLNFLKLKDRIRSIKDDYDFIILDSSPSLNEEVLSTMLASDILLMVTTADYPTLSCSLKAANLAKQRGKNIAGIIINKIRDPDYELTLKEIEEATEIPVIARIPDDKKAIRSLFTRIPLSVYDKKAKFTREITKLSAALTNSKEKRSFFRRIFSSDLRKEEVNRELLRDTFYARTFQ